MESLGFGEPLPDVKCKATKCEEGLHCFRPKRAAPLTLVGGACHACKEDSVDWQQAYKRDISQVDALFSELRKEYIRQHFWDVPINDKFKRRLLIKGKNKLKVEAAKRIKSSVREAGTTRYQDGTQTPTKKYNIIYFAQHATATCCRKCIKYWHGIPYDRDLEPAEEIYLQQLITKYIETRLPDLPDEGSQLALSLDS
jgi:Domain of unknown function (DUF4186)